MHGLLLTHPDCLRHDPGAGHPERPARLRAVLDALAPLEADGRLERLNAPLPAREALHRIHPEAHLAALEAAVPQHGHAALDADTVLSPGSLDAAMRAAGAVLHAVERVMAGSATRAFCAVRPPGHHAEPARAMGFCLLGNAALGAVRALELGVARVAVVDFDVHHGNGTEAALAGRSDVLVCSVFQHPLYPYPDLHRSPTNAVYVPLPAGSDGYSFRAAVTQQVLPALAAFAPELILISAGFDAHRADPLADLRLEDADYAWITAALVEQARRSAHGRVVSTLEGGYDLAALARATRAHVDALLDAPA